MKKIVTILWLHEFHVKIEFYKPSLLQLVEVWYVHTSGLIAFLKLNEDGNVPNLPLSKDKTPWIVNDLIWHSHVSFLSFPFLSSLPTTYQEYREKPRLSLFLYTQNGLQHLISYSLRREHIHLLSGLQHSSVFFFLLVNAFKRFRATMVFVLFWICWLSKTSGYRVVSCGVTRRNRWP